MVKVFSVHHFIKQDVTDLDKVGGSSVCHGGGDLICIGGQHKIEIRDLKDGSKLVCSFPTVDHILQLIYNCRGNYICTLECHLPAFNSEMNFVRVYQNWGEDSFNQPMKARIAGKVSPMSQYDGKCLEMIEIPTRESCHSIACCPITGNLALGSNFSVIIVRFFLKLHDLSKRRYVDFEEILHVEVGFRIKELVLIEDIIGCLGNNNFHTLQITNVPHEKFSSSLVPMGANKEYSQLPTSEPSENSDSANCSIDPEDILEMSPNTARHTFNLGSKNKNLDEDGRCIIKRHTNFVDASNLNWRPTFNCKRRNNKDHDFLIFPSLVGNVYCDVPVDSGETIGPSVALNNVNVKTFDDNNCLKDLNGDVIALTLIHQRIEVDFDSGLPFSNLRMEPVFSQKEFHSLPMMDDPLVSLFGSPSEGFLRKCGVSVFFSTPYTGTLYHVTLASDPLKNEVVRGASFTYTSAVSSVEIEPCLLHALTETGLETYTVRPHPQYLNDFFHAGKFSITVPSNWGNLPCLFGLRPFLNVQSMALTNSCLALIAITDPFDHSPRFTLYSLHLPTTSDIYHEIIRIGAGFKESALSEYFHLLMEAHMALISSRAAASSFAGMHKESVACRESIETLSSLLKQSSALLADYFARQPMKVDWEQAVHYYRASTLSLEAILEKNSSQNTISLPFIVKSFLMAVDTPIMNSKQANRLIDFMAKVDPGGVSELIVSATCMKDYDRDKALLILKKQLTIEGGPRPLDVVALMLIMLEKEQLVEQIGSVAALVPPSVLCETLSDFPHILLSQSGNGYALTSLAQMLARYKTDVFVDSLVGVLDKGTSTLDELVDCYMDAFPIVSFGHDCDVNSLRLRAFIEGAFIQPATRAKMMGKRDSFKKSVSILIGFYSASLLGAFKRENDEERRFTADRRCHQVEMFSIRPSYLNYLDPFKGCDPPPPSKCKRLNCSPSLPTEDLTSNGGLEIHCANEIYSKTLKSCHCSFCTTDLLLLQSLMSSDLPSAENCSTVLRLVDSNPDLCGSLSLRILCISPVDRLNLLIEEGPQAILQYCKDTYSCYQEWNEVISKILLKQESQTDGATDLAKKLKSAIKDILNHLTFTCSLDQFVNFLPKNMHEQFRCQIQECHSTEISKLIEDVIRVYSKNALDILNKNKN